jgi:hypothetical protein
MIQVEGVCMEEERNVDLQAALEDLRDKVSALSAAIHALMQALALQQGAPPAISSPTYPPPGGTWSPTVTWDWSGRTSNRPASNWDWSGTAPPGGTRAA